MFYYCFCCRLSDSLGSFFYYYEEQSVWAKLIITRNLVSVLNRQGKICFGVGQVVLDKLGLCLQNEEQCWNEEKKAVAFGTLWQTTKSSHLDTNGRYMDTWTNAFICSTEKCLPWSLCLGKDGTIEERMGQF